jgi:transcription elongation factor GreA
MTATRIWLTGQAHELLKRELTELLRQRAMPSAPVLNGDDRADVWDSSTDHQVLVSEQDRNQRIRRLQEILLNSVVDHEPADDGVAEPGMLLTVRYESDSEVETFLLAQRDEAASADFEVCSPDSPLGRALCGAREGEQRHYRLPDGRAMTVSLIRAVPYRAG